MSKKIGYYIIHHGMIVDSIYGTRVYVKRTVDKSAGYDHKISALNTLVIKMQEAFNVESITFHYNVDGDIFVTFHVDKHPQLDFVITVKDGNPNAGAE